MTTVNSTCTPARGCCDAWTTNRLAGRPASHWSPSSRVTVDLARAGVVSRLDGEWFPTLPLDY